MVVTTFLGSWIITESVKAPEDEMVKIYDANIKPCMNYWTTDTGFVDTVSMQAQAMKLYDEGEYTLAIEAFQRFEPETKDEALYNFYLGFCYLKSDFANLAISHFDESSQLFKKFELVQMSRWYLALAYLKVGDEENAVKVLQNLIEVNAPQRYVADNILKQIDFSSNPIKSLLLVVAD
ncbi:MAG: tetratricopeptide repeat protein [Bacteroidota bacterium]|nr:tetratricopeptide repeat protein [Bacteroidota bacterium]